MRRGPSATSSAGRPSTSPDAAPDPANAAGCRGSSRRVASEAVLDVVLGQRYRVVRLLGQGGMGAVYEAEDTREGRTVAVKVITGDLGRSTTLLGRFEQERRAAAAIDSPHIARFLDAGTDHDRPFMVM